MLGQAVSWTGTWMQRTAQAWLVYRLTQSPAWLGAVGFASQFPALFLAPIAGVLVDRFSRWRLVVLTQSLSMLAAIALAALTLSENIGPWGILILSLISGCIDSLDIPARQAFMEEVAGKEDLLNAIALNSSTFNGARLVGPAIAGALVASAGEGTCFLINAISYLAMLFGLLRMRVTPRPPAEPAPLWHGLREGFRFARGHAAIRSILLLLLVASLTIFPYIVLVPVFAKDEIRAGAQGLGLLLSASGVGALCAALTLARRESASGLMRYLGLATLGASLFLALFSQSKNLPLSMALLAAAGFCTMTLMTATNTLIQSMSPETVRGRIMSFYTMIFMGIGPLGSLAVGWLADWAGAPTALAAGAAAGAIAAMHFLSLQKRFERF